MTLTLIGLGLDPNDLPIRAHDGIAASEVVLVETYASRPTGKSAKAPLPTYQAHTNDHTQRNTTKQ
ncbi:MAG: hypothetical protein ACMXYM_00885 [Candidatus Woesearchaeota archaeon]